VVLMSCELVVDIDVPYEGDRIVVNAIQGPAGPWTIELTKSRYILDNANVNGNNFNYDPVAIAEVTLYEENGTSYLLNHLGLGYYSTERYPQEGAKYRIVAHAEGFRDIDAEMSVPYAVRIIDVEWDSTNVRTPQLPPGQSPPFTPNYSVNVPMRLTFADPPGVKNFYAILVHIYSTHHYNDPQTQEPRTDSLASVTRTWITDPAIATEEDRKMRFPDNAFEGSTYTANMIAQLRTNPNQEIYRISVVLVSLSEEYFRYEESRELYFQNDGDPFAQPVQTYSNINNGHGIFAGYATDEVSWDR
jgi:hypothetical protein